MNSPLTGPASLAKAIVASTLTTGRPLEPAGFGTLGPDEQAPEVDPDCLLIPLAVFDRRGNRIGYGAGYYDAAIARLERRKRILTIGLAFSVQEVADVVTEEHDKRLDYIITENTVIDCRARSELP